MGDEMLMTMQHAAQPALHSMAFPLFFTGFSAASWNWFKCNRSQEKVNRFMQGKVMPEW